jgi:hypothetical protein
MARVRRGRMSLDHQEHTHGGDVSREENVGPCVPQSLGVNAQREPRESLSRLPALVGIWPDAPQRTMLAHGSLPGLTVRGFGGPILGDGATGSWRLAEEPFPAAVQRVDDSHARE